MRAYFSQFGDIRRLRLSRNRKTGQSKHYAFIEFKSSEVAQIVADTMDNYLMFGHILKCKIVPREQIHEKLWKGANKRFKKVPWNRLEGRALNKGKTREEWNKKILAETKSRKDKQEKLKAIGYDFEPPALKSVEDVPKQIATEPPLEDTNTTGDGEQKALTESDGGEAGAPTAGTIDEDVSAKKGRKKDKKSKAKSELEPVPEIEMAEAEAPTAPTVADEAKPSVEKKAKKAKKSKTKKVVA